MAFSDNTIGRLQYYFASGDRIYTDFSVEVESEILQCHRFLMAACSQFFLGLFRSGMQETKRNSVSLKDISSESFKLIYRSIYLDENRLNEDNVLDVWKTADFLQIDHLVSACQTLVLETMNESNCHRYLWHAKFLDRMVMSRIMGYIKSNFDRFIDNVCLMELDGEDLLSIVKDPDTRTSEEENIVEAVLKWVSHTTPDEFFIQDSGTVNSMTVSTTSSISVRSGYLVKLLSVSRLTSLQLPYLTNLVEHHLIKGNSGARDLIDKAWMYLSDHRPSSWPQFACHRRYDRYEDVVLMPSGSSFIEVFSMTERKSTGALDSHDLPRNAVVIFHIDKLYACSYTTASQANLLSFFVQENCKWRNVTNVRLGDNVCNETNVQFGDASMGQYCPGPHANQNTLWTFTHRERIFVVHAPVKRIFQWDPARNNGIKPLTYVPTAMAIVYATLYESSIFVICGTADDAATLNVYDTAREEWDDTVTLEGFCTQGVSSFYRGDKLYFLTSDAKLYVVEPAGGGVTLKYIGKISNLSFPLIGAHAYCEDLFLFVKESTSTAVWDPYPESLLLQEMFHKVHVIVTQNPCTCHVLAWIPRLN